MNTLQFEVSNKELVAIREYAVMCGESISDLIRKIIVCEITFKHSLSASDPDEYEYRMLVPANISDQEEMKIIESNYNRIRKILGWREINLR